MAPVTTTHVSQSGGALRRRGRTADGESAGSVLVFTMAVLDYLPPDRFPIVTTAPPGERQPLASRLRQPVASRLRRAAPSFAGPLLIVLGVLGILHAFAFQGRISNGDPPTYWLPTWCFLGHALRAGHVPLWNPYTLAGTPFASDPQSGWMYLPPMILFSALSCGAAIRWMLLLQPILAGLGMLWFLRSEGLSRLGASTGGVVLAFVVAGSEVVLSLPFAAMLAWTSVSLALLARSLRTE